MNIVIVYQGCVFIEYGIASAFGMDASQDGRQWIGPDCE